MKLGSKECDDALRNYKTSNRAEELMVELLLIPEDAEDEVYAAMTIKICDELGDDELFNNLVDIVVRIREELEIED